ncbi:FAD-dependent oxidoreductase [Kibdelosporangium philippinense]|uniref:FAD-dependent oxidoreductase n=1 Tax=Kibdelosporangium philippinense TaxID=211113 RepID=A0ABS8ZWP2_9PSEU|nr:FAD-dependent oxidoreductase [Kibdelosporangium philippinense]MCE7012089.1 FAD-dependent oxidoreductase [Kibdelosporangium philippinense]
MQIVRKDVVVVGLGAFGSAALWRLAQRGLTVAGIEQHAIGHDQGSSHGGTRLFRIACMEHPSLSAIALKSLELWTALGAQTGETYVHQTGLLYVGNPDSKAITVPQQAGVPVELLTNTEVVERQPQYNVQPGQIGVWDPGAGICYPELSVRAHVAAAERLGADVHANTNVLAIEGNTVYTPTLAIEADQIVIAAGAGLRHFVPDLPLKHTPTPVSWFRPKDSADFSLAKFPAFVWDFSEEMGLWGHGSTADFAVKVGAHPLDTVDVEDAVAQAFPSLAPKPFDVKPCHVTDSPDEQFLVGRISDHVTVAGGDSGHGFKHCAGIGELLAQIVTGEPTYCPIEFMDPTRFAS